MKSFHTALAILSRYGKKNFFSLLMFLVTMLPIEIDMKPEKGYAYWKLKKEKPWWWTCSFSFFFQPNFINKKHNFFSINVEISLDFNKVSNEKRSQKKTFFSFTTLVCRPQFVTHILPKFLFLFRVFRLRPELQFFISCLILEPELSWGYYALLVH